MLFHCMLAHQLFSAQRREVYETQGDYTNIQSSTAWTVEDDGFGTIRSGNGFGSRQIWKLEKIDTKG